MGSFTWQVKTEEGKLDFNFLRVFTANGTRYYVTVIDHHHKPHLFHMAQQNELWKIVDNHKVPDWIQGVEEQLARVIIENQEIL